MAWRASTMLTAATLMLGVSGPAPAAAPPWPDKAYPYVVVDQDLVAVLTEFGQNMGTPVQVSDTVHGRVIGRIPPMPPRAFLDRLASQYGFNWYYDGSTLAIAANSELVERTLPLGKTSFDALNADLDRLDISDSRYRLRHAEGSDLVMVAGPPRYAQLVEQTLNSLNKEHPSAVKLYLGDVPPQEPPKPAATAPAQGTSAKQN
jgi:type III secretion protein C